MSDRSRQRLRTILTILATTLIIAPAAALATHGFTDVHSGDFFHGAVDWMKDNGVTVGCNPPDNTRYCPDQPVTRGEMAVFLERLDSKNVFLRPGEVDAFLPVAIFTVYDGSIANVDFRDPVTATPTISGSDGSFTIDFPGFTFSGAGDHTNANTAVCTALLRDLNVELNGVGGNLNVVLWRFDGSQASGTEDDFTCAVYDNS